MMMTGTTNEKKTVYRGDDYEEKARDEWSRVHDGNGSDAYLLMTRYNTFGVVWINDPPICIIIYHKHVGCMHH